MIDQPFACIRYERCGILLKSGDPRVEDTRGYDEGGRRAEVPHCHEPDPRRNANAANSRGRVRSASSIVEPIHSNSIGGFRCRELLLREQPDWSFENGNVHIEEINRLFEETHDL